MVGRKEAESVVAVVEAKEMEEVVGNKVVERKKV